MEDLIDDRRDEILRALVEEHIRTAEPVSSRAILEATNLQVSAATIRNELSALDREGFAIQPHTSAGRVPTAKAYRYYVDHLTAPRMRVATQQRISGFFSTVHLELGRLLKATTELLSEITQFPAVAITPGPSGETVRALHIVHLGEENALLVVVTSTGRVSQELVRVSETLTAPDLELVEAVVAGAVVGSDLGMASIPSVIELPSHLRTMVTEVASSLKRTQARTAEVYIGGTHQMTMVWDNLSTVHRVLEVLEEEARMLDILADVSGTSIQLASEMGMEAGVDMAVVSSSFLKGTSTGRVGVIGPMRMDYKKVISTVEGVSRQLGDRIGP